MRLGERGLRPIPARRPDGGQAYLGGAEGSGIAFEVDSKSCGRRPGRRREAASVGTVEADGRRTPEGELGTVLVIDWTNARRAGPDTDVALTWLLMAAFDHDLDADEGGPPEVR